MSRVKKLKFKLKPLHELNLAKYFIPHPDAQYAEHEVRNALEYVRGGGKSRAIALLGESGTGKTKLCDTVIADFPRSRDKDGLTVPILKISTPDTPTVMNLAERMLEALGDPVWEKGSAHVKTRRLVKLLRGAGTYGVFVEEFNHFVDKRTSKIWHNVADWLKLLMDEVSIALIVTGLEYSEQVIACNEQLQRRFDCPIVLRRFRWDIEEERAQFFDILESMDEVIREYINVPELHNESMAFRIWCATGGLMGYLFKLADKILDGARHRERSDRAEKRRFAKAASADLSDFESAYAKCVHYSHRVQWASSPFSRDFDSDAREGQIALAMKLGMQSDDDSAASGGECESRACPQRRRAYRSSTKDRARPTVRRRRTSAPGKAAAQGQK